MDRKDKDQVRDISKKIKQESRENKRSKRHKKVQNEFKGIRSIESIKTRKILITHARNDSGSIEATRERHCQHIREIRQRSFHK